jgi:hypoxanthine phosphoribosyltransferase
MKKNKQILLYRWDEFFAHIDEIEKQIRLIRSNFKNIYGVPRGGLIPATILSHRLNLPMIFSTTMISDSTLIVDDICDTGKTLKKIMRKNSTIIVLWLTSRSKIQPFYFNKVKGEDEPWIVFPWETLGSSKYDNTLK